MKTRLLSILIFSVAFSFAQVVITGQSTPTTLNQNSNFTVSFTYTSTVQVPVYQIQLYNTLPMVILITQLVVQ
ncbi:MAG: hypothetical protein HC854_07015 [Flavobacterium sp.]|nr:hypothetical protein [Flavobacterium sp.]